ncbi:MAG TPA: F0F1 ATP synthase subunit A [Bryobacteraceae bacterium]|nr:F0F1 ATP synthase subunit A [Bryobacteraceae bacterium]
MEHEVWLTVLLNRWLAGPADAVLQMANAPHDPAHPWSNWASMELLVAAIIVIVFAVLRGTLSADNPGRMQHIFEVVYEFVRGQARDTIAHHSDNYARYFGTLFIFILFMNLIGLIPGFESPTMSPSVPLGLAVCTFLYYNWMGIRAQGFGHYLMTFIGPVWWLFFLMIPIEIISHLARPLSLTVRLFANMFAGEKVTVTFLTLTYFAAPAIFMGLHVFVAFLQAYIFMLLTIIYVSMAVSHEH